MLCFAPLPPPPPHPLSYPDTLSLSVTNGVWMLRSPLSIITNSVWILCLPLFHFSVVVTLSVSLRGRVSGVDRFGWSALMLARPKCPNSCVCLVVSAIHIVFLLLRRFSLFCFLERFSYTSGVPLLPSNTVLQHLSLVLLFCPSLRSLPSLFSSLWCSLVSPSIIVLYFTVSFLLTARSVVFSCTSSSGTSLLIFPAHSSNCVPDITARWRVLFPVV